jgi:hypothetical protein
MCVHSVHISTVLLTFGERSAEMNTQQIRQYRDAFKAVIGIIRNDKELAGSEKLPRQLDRLMGLVQGSFKLYVQFHQVLRSSGHTSHERLLPYHLSQQQARVLRSLSDMGFQSDRVKTLLLEVRKNALRKRAETTDWKNRAHWHYDLVADRLQANADLVFVLAKSMVGLVTDEFDHGT